MKKDLGFLLRVDPIRCDGFGHCHELAPDLVDIDEWGYPVIRQVVTSLHDRGALRSARFAVRGCPRQALEIERVSEN
ncbi:MAG TPA: ferredoxin [Acidimicrobiales bacterium]|nr:ferredoxin [Acidimicrobiales bacterium]